jgi:hypothetical protein
MSRSARQDAEQYSWRTATESVVESYELAIERQRGRPKTPKPLRVIRKP